LITTQNSTTVSHIICIYVTGSQDWGCCSPAPPPHVTASLGHSKPNNMGVGRDPKICQRCWGLPLGLVMADHTKTQSSPCVMILNMAVQAYVCRATGKMGSSHPTFQGHSRSSEPIRLNWVAMISY